MTTDREILELAADGLQHIAVFGELQNALEKIDMLAADPTFVIGSSKELNAIHAVIASIGGDWPEDEGDPYTLYHVKRMARELSAFQRAAVAQQVAAPAYTEGHCKEKSKPGGCQLHNLHCGYPACDRKAAAPQPPQPEPRKPLTEALIEKAFEATVERFKGRFVTPLNYFQSGVFLAEAVHGITGEKK